MKITRDHVPSAQAHVHARGSQVAYNVFLASEKHS